MDKNKKFIIIFVLSIVIIGVGAIGINRYNYFKNARILREKQQEQRDKREEQRQENLKNGVEPTKQIRIPDFEGMTINEARSKIENLGISEHLESVETIDSEMNEGLIVKATPKQGTSFYEGQTIHFTFYVSNGKLK